MGSKFWTNIADTYPPAFFGGERKLRVLLQRLCVSPNE